MLPNKSSYRTNEEIIHKIKFEDYVDGPNWTTDELERLVLLELKGLDPMPGWKVTVTIKIHHLTPEMEKKLWNLHLGGVH
jgi:hypothetical protein